MNITEAVNNACEKETLADALTYICIWESERLVKYVRNNTGSWETCFGICIKSVMEKYNGNK